MTSSPVLSPASRIILLLAGGAVALWGMGQYVDFILSLTFVILIALAADPLVNWLRRKGLGRGAVLAIAVLAVYAALELLALLFIYTGAQFLKQLPTYIE